MRMRLIVRTQSKIKRKMERGGVSIISQSEEKTYRVSFLKRRRLNDNTSPSIWVYIYIYIYIYIRSEC